MWPFQLEEAAHAGRTVDIYLAPTMVMGVRQVLPENLTLVGDDTQDVKDSLYMSVEMMDMNSAQRYGGPKKSHLLGIFLPSFQIFYEHGYSLKVRRMKWPVKIYVRRDHGWTMIHSSESLRT